MTRMLLTVLGLALGALAIAGCGGSSNSSSSTGTSSVNTGSTGATTSASTTSTLAGTDPGPVLSAPQLIARADRICRRLNTKFEDEKGAVSSQQGIVRVAPRRAAAEQKALSEMSKLSPPGSIAAAYQQILAARKTLIEDTIKLAQYAAANKVSAENPLFASSTEVGRQMAVAAQSIGLKDCGSIS